MKENVHKKGKEIKKRAIGRKGEEKKEKEKKNYNKSNDRKRKRKLGKKR